MLVRCKIDAAGYPVVQSTLVSQLIDEDHFSSVTERSQIVF